MAMVKWMMQVDICYPFLALNEVMICNTGYMKNFHKAAWQHPKSNQQHCIDYVIIKQKGQGMCLDVSVKRGAECNNEGTKEVG